MADHSSIPAGWIDTQRRIAAQVDTSRDAVLPESLHYVAGADVTFSALDPTLCVACLVVCSFPSLMPVAIRHMVLRIDVPYIPGFLAFREADAVLALLDALAREPGTHPVPQLVLIDGNGVLHGMGAGVACHVGIRGGIPTIGAAKTFFSVSGRLSGDAVKAACRKHLHTRGDYLLLLEGEAGSAPLGAAVWATSDAASAGAPSREGSRASSRCCGALTAQGAYLVLPQGPSAAASVAGSIAGGGGGGCNPMFVSVGHSMTLQGALALALSCCLHRVPEPVRLADKHSRRVMADLDAAVSSSGAAPAELIGVVVAASTAGMPAAGASARSAVAAAASGGNDGDHKQVGGAAGGHGRAWSGPGPAYVAPALPASSGALQPASRLVAGSASNVGPLSAGDGIACPVGVLHPRGRSWAAIVVAAVPPA